MLDAGDKYYMSTYLCIPGCRSVLNLNSIAAVTIYITRSIIISGYDICMMSLFRRHSCSEYCTCLTQKNKCEIIATYYYSSFAPHFFPLHPCI